MNGGKPTNIPSLWMGADGPVQLDDAAAVDAALKSGLVFPSFANIAAAETAARERSARGGVTAGPLGTPSMFNVPLSRVRSVDVNLRPVEPVGEPTRDTDLGEQVTAAIRLENVTAAVGEEIFNTKRWFNAEPGFNPADHLAPGEELDLPYLSGARSLAEFNAQRDELATERMLRQQLGDGPLPALLAGTLAVLSDPITYLPIFGWGKGAVSVGKLMVGVGLRGGAEVAASELALQAVQKTRTAEESAVSIMLGGAFGAGLGGIAGAAAGRSHRAAVQEFTALARAGEFEGNASAGAMAVPTYRPEDTVMAGSLGIAKALKAMKLVSPGVELAMSANPASRVIGAQLVDVGTVWKGAFEGVAAPRPVEIAIASHDGPIVKSGAVMRSLHAEHRAARGDQAMSWSNWKEVVTRVMRRGDFYPEASVQKAAAELRKVVEYYKKLAIKFNLLPVDVDVKTADSYITRVYDTRKIEARSGSGAGSFEKIVETHLRHTIKGDEFASDGEYALAAQDITRAILGSSSARVPFVQVPRLRGPMKERTFNIPDHLIEEFLVNDIELIMGRFIRTMAADVEMARAFGKADPNKNLEELILAEADKAKALAKTEKERLNITDAAKRDVELVTTLANRVRGVGAMPNSPGMAAFRTVGRVARDWNFVRMLGPVMLGSIPDIGMMSLNEGVARTFGPLLYELGTGFKQIRMGKAEAQEFGVGVDYSRGTQAKALFDVGERYEATNIIERASDTAAHQFANISLVNLWNTGTKSATGAIASSRILRTSRKIAEGKQLTRRETYRLAQSYISPEMAKRIAAQQEHWVEAPHLSHANVELWKDAEAAEAFKSAVIADVRRTILTPGHGDAWLWTGTEWGKTVWQFKRYASAATTRILLLNMQVRDKTTLGGLAVLFGMGALSQALRDIADTGEVKDRTAREWAVNAVDRSGALGLLVEADAIFNKLGGLPGEKGGVMQSLAGAEPSRFAQRGLVEQVLGPTASAVEDLRAALAATNEDMGGARDFTMGELRRLRRLVPGQNLFYLNYLFDQAEAGLGGALGLPEQQARPTNGRLPNPAQP